MGVHRKRHFFCAICGVEFDGYTEICRDCRDREVGYGKVIIPKIPLAKEMAKLKKQDEANRKTVREAEELGLSYGQYQALKYLGRL